MRFLEWLFPPANECDKECTFVLQWHLSDKCNLRCTHCYQADGMNEITSCYYKKVLDQFEDLIQRFKKERKCNIRGMVTLTGGEPLLYPHFLDVCAEVKRRHFLLGILTNGTLITSEYAEKIKSYDPYYVQVSIDGAEDTHNAIRGQGAFRKTVDGLARLIKQGIRTSISFTAHAQNYKEFYDVAKTGATVGASCVWSDRLIPFGNGEQMKEQCLTPTQTEEFFHIMKKAKIDFAGKTYVKMQRALQFLVADEQPYQCTAGKLLLTLLPNGDIYPCRRMPISVGNIQDTTLSKVFFGHAVMKMLRNEHLVAKECANCEKVRQCKNGLRCLSYAIHGTPFKKDPGCWINTK